MNSHENKKENVGKLEMHSQVEFHVAFATSEDPSRPASNLELLDSKHPGWQSKPFVTTFISLSYHFIGFFITNSFGTFPQVIVLELNGGVYQINLLQILCHEFKIPTEVDIYIGSRIAPSTVYSEHNVSYSFLGFIFFFSSCLFIYNQKNFIF